MRVDALTTAYKIDVLPTIQRQLDLCRKVADRTGVAEFRLRRFRFALKRSRTVGLFPFSNADAYGIYDKQGPNGWQLEVVFYASHLATHSLPESIELANQIAEGFGRVRESRLRRFDLAVDVVGIHLGSQFSKRLTTMRAGKEKHLAGSENERCAEFSTAAGQTTGVTIASGNSLSACVYDKTHHVNLPGSCDKKALEYAIWNRAGWNGIERVTRIEFRHRGEYLKEVGLRDPSKLAKSLDKVWQADVRWLKLIIPGTATRPTRCKLDPRWFTVMGAVFEHPSTPIERSRGHRGGARPAHVLGAAVSRIASTGDLQILLDQAPSDSPDTFITMSDEEARGWVDKRIELLFRAAGSDVFRDLEKKGRTPQATAWWLSQKLKGQAARFSSTDDNEENSK